MLAVPDWVEHPDAYTAGVEACIKANAFKGRQACWLDEDLASVEPIKWLRVAAEKKAFLNKTAQHPLRLAHLTESREAAVGGIRDDARKAVCCGQGAEGAKGIIPFVIAAAAAGKAVIARREALGHEPKPVVDASPRFMAESKRRERVCEAARCKRQAKRQALIGVPNLDFIENVTVDTPLRHGQPVPCRGSAGMSSEGAVDVIRVVETLRRPPSVCPTGGGARTSRHAAPDQSEWGTKTPAKCSQR